MPFCYTRAYSKPILRQVLYTHTVLYGESGIRINGISKHFGYITRKQTGGTLLW